MACDHNCSSCGHASCGKNQSMLITTNENNHIKKIIAVMSGKGGVGKSMVTTTLAVSLAKKGYKVGILDSDITGPSIPKAFGLKPGVTGNSDNLMFPPMTKDLGIKVISINVLIDNPAEPVVWRGPVLGSAIKQFYQDVLWEELDYLLIDMPPGTSDVALTVFQMIPVDGVVIVSTPQDLVKMIVGKAVHMCEMMDVPVLGLVENMSYMECSCCNNKIYPFGESKLVEVADEYNILALGSMPINPEFAKLIDAGKAEEIDSSFMKDIVDLLMSNLN